VKRRIHILLGLLSLVIFQGGCTIPQTSQARAPYDTYGVHARFEEKYKATLASSIRVKDDEFSKSVTFLGVEMHNGDLGHHLLRSWKDKKTGVVTHQLYVSDNYRKSTSESWKFYRGARDEEANDLKFVTINRDVNCQSLRYAESYCSFYETFGVMLDESFLRQKADAGFRIKALAKSGEDEVFTVTPQAIQQQLEAIYGKNWRSS